MTSIDMVAIWSSTWASKCPGKHVTSTCGRLDVSLHGVLREDGMLGCRFTNSRDLSKPGSGFIHLSDLVIPPLSWRALV